MLLTQIFIIIGHIPTVYAVGLHCDLFAVELLSACGINKKKG
jgi:hypothetical protein